ncbi:SH3 domain-containing protein [Streptomyces sp. NPDC020742]|uniref:SH3 domain-containing protein n=1 Tax=Streptomyces sp. NPDC020742 TaxID=3154897 RepID=UPI00340444E1
MSPQCTPPGPKPATLARYALAGILAGALTAVPARAADTQAGTDDGRPTTSSEGRVVARDGLVVRTGPSTDYRPLGSKRYGTVVGIVCRLNGQRLKGNPVWYKLTDSSYAWSSADGIAHDGAEPDWC